MSRCFPYPPPGYSLKSASDEALIESIKLQRGREKAKAERKKDKKREKKEKKIDRKEKRKQNSSEIGHGEERKFDDEKIHKGGKSRADLKGGYIQKSREDEAEQLERSGLTEEHERPICSQNPCYSSDSIENSNKRRRHTTSLNENRNHGNIIRIRLPLQKHKEPEAGKEQPSSTSGRIDLPARKELCSTSVGTRQKEVCSTTMGIDQDLTPRPDKELSCSTSGITGIFTQQTASVSTSLEDEMQRAVSMYKDLVENWVPPALQSDIEGQEWLFGKKHHDRPREKRFRPSNDVCCCGSSALWPCAQYLPDADIYALPFTVPF